MKKRNLILKSAAIFLAAVLGWAVGIFTPFLGEYWAFIRFQRAESEKEIDRYSNFFERQKSYFLSVQYRMILDNAPLFSPKHWESLINRSIKARDIPKISNYLTLMQIHSPQSDDVLINLENEILHSPYPIKLSILLVLDYEKYLELMPEMHGIDHVLEQFYRNIHSGETGKTLNTQKNLTLIELVDFSSDGNTSPGGG